MILGKYNQAKTITFDLVAPDGVDLIVNATFAAGDVVIMKDEGAEANTTNLPTDEGSGYSLVLTATEMSAARIRIYIIDQTGTKIWLDISFGIETYGHASAEHEFDLDSPGDWNTVVPNTVVPDNAGIASNGVAIGLLNDFDPAVDTVVNVTNVANNADMRGTDGANTIAPDNAGIAANGVAIAALNDFDPAVDTVVNVTNVATNADMRGTDGANTIAPNTVAPDNAGIAANGAAIAVVSANTQVPQKNVAFNNLLVLMVSSTDHVTPKTGLTITVTKSLNGGAFVATTGAIAEISNGMYQFDASAADMNGDAVTFKFTSTGADDSFMTVYTKP